MGSSVRNNLTDSVQNGEIVKSFKWEIGLMSGCSDVLTVQGAIVQKVRAPDQKGAHSKKFLLISIFKLVVWL